MLEVESLEVCYGAMRAIHDVTFQVRKDETVVLLGANGAGKSTVLRAISGLLRPTAGAIRFLGHSLDRMPANSIVGLGLAHVPEGRRLFQEMSVEENLIMGSLAPAAKARRADSLAWVYELFPRLLERRRQMAGTLSGGEQQMVAVGRGLMARPRILMLDEPSLGLSPLLAREIFRIIATVRQQGLTVLLVEQNVPHSLAICDRAYVLENGRTIMTGTGRELAGNDHIRKTYLGLV